MARQSFESENYEVIGVSGVIWLFSGVDVSFGEKFVSFLVCGSASSGRNRSRVSCELVIMLINNRTTSVFLLVISVTLLVVANRDPVSERQQLVRKHLKRLKKEEGAIKLVGGKQENEGNVEIFHDNRWGSICDDEFVSKTNFSEINSLL